MSGNTQAPPMLQNRPEQGFIVQDQVATLLISQQLNQPLGGTDLWPQHAENKIDVLGRELDPAVGLNDFHNYTTTQIVIIEYGLKINQKMILATPIGTSAGGTQQEP